MSLRILGGSSRVSCLHGFCGFALAASGVLGVTSLAACGQKGPLFMPPPPRTTETAAGQTAGAPATPASAPAATSALPAPPPASGPAMLPLR